MSILSRLTTTLLAVIVSVAALLLGTTAIDRARGLEPVPAPALAALAPDAGRLFPAFDPAVSDYLLKTRTTVETVDLGVVANDAGAVVGCAGDAGTLDCAAVALAVGDTPVTITVIAADTTTASYTVTINRAAADASGISDLVALTASTGTLSPAFDPNVDDYALDAGTARNVELVYTLPDGADASCAIDGEAGDCSVIMLASGTAPVDRVVTILVTALDQVGTTTYTITISRQPETNATLTTITPSEGSFVLPFDPESSAAQLVTTSAASISLHPTVADSEATLVCLVDEMAASCDDIALEIVSAPDLSATRVIEVTAEDGSTTRRYTIDIRRDAAPSADAALTALSISDAALAPTFDPAVVAYTATTIASEVVVDATPADGASVACTIDEMAAPCSPLSLELGETILALTVTAADGSTTATYTVTLTRDEPSTDASLIELAISETDLAPAFDPGVFAYAGTTAAEVVDVSATPAEGATAVCALDGTEQPCAGIPLELGANRIDIIVTAEDGTTTATTLVTLTRRSTDASLVGLALSSGTLAPSFDATVFAYTATTSADVIAVSAIAADGATVTCTIGGVASACDAVALILGANTIEITVTAEDLVTTAMTTISVTRLSTDAALRALVVRDGLLTPAFDPAVGAYVVTTEAPTIAIEATPAPGATAICERGGAPIACAAIELPIGTTRLAVLVTAEDLVTTTRYTISVTRRAPAVAVAETAPDEPTDSVSVPVEAPVVTPEETGATPVVRTATDPVATPTTTGVDPILLGGLVGGIGLLLGAVIAGVALYSSRTSRTRPVGDIEYGI